MPTRMIRPLTTGPWSFPGQGCAPGPQPQGAEGQKIDQAALAACRHWQERAEVLLLQEGTVWLLPGRSLESIEAERLADEAREAGGDIVSFAQRILRGDVPTPSPDLMELADRAARQCAERQREDVRAWAERLAGDVGDATD